MRREGWEQSLIDTIEAAKGRPFAWGEADCCLFVADAVAVMTGRDPAEKLRGRYSTEKGALRTLGGDFAQAIEKLAAEFGLEEVPVAMAQRGDVVLLENGERMILGIIDTHGLICAMSATGVIQLPISQAVTAWRV